MLIALEGGEGAGKSTQLAALVARLEGAGHEVEASREPGGTPGAEAIRALIVSGVTDRWTAATDALLIAAARADHVARRIRPALEAGRIVVVDRFIHSTLAYQGHGKGVPLHDLRMLHRFATGDLWPDLVLWIDVPPEIGLARAKARGAPADRFEGFDAPFHARVRAGFGALAAADPRICRIDGTEPEPKVAEAVWRAVEAALARQRRSA